MSECFPKPAGQASRLSLRPDPLRSDYITRTPSSLLLLRLRAGPPARPPLPGPCRSRSRPSGQPYSPALSAGARLAEATRAAYVIIERPSGSAAGRDVAVSAFMAAAGALDAAVENLAAHASAPMSAILARQRVRLEQAHIALRESLAASAAGKDVSGGLAAAQSMRERHPVLSHRSRPAPDAPGCDATTLAAAGFPQPAPGSAGAATRQHTAQSSPARLRVPARRRGTYGALL